MSARNSFTRACGFAAISLALVPVTSAQGTPLKVNLTETAEPDSRPWEDPARISLTINPHGRDTFSAQVNLELEQRIQRPSGRWTGLGGNIVWNRESGGNDRQNNLEAGAFYSVDYNPMAHIDPHSGSTPEQQSNFIDLSSRASIAYARTADYPDLSTPVCVATPALRQCQTQFKESIRTSFATSIFHPALEQRAGSFSFSIAPKLGLDYDHLISSPLNSAGAELTGGYLSAKAALGVSIVPNFDNPGFELAASVQLRQRLFASDSRRPNIDSSAVLFKASATYYFVRPTEEGGWRAGVGVAYTRGDDPLNGQRNVNRIVLALRLGRY